MLPHQQWQPGYYPPAQQPGSWQQQQYAQPQQQWQQAAAWPQHQPAGVWPQQQQPQAWGPPASAQTSQYQQQVTAQQPGQWAPQPAAVAAVAPPLPAEPQFAGQQVAQPHAGASVAADIGAPMLSQEDPPPLPQEAAPPLPEEAAPPLPPGPPLPPHEAVPPQPQQQAQQAAYLQQQQQHQTPQLAGQGAYPQQQQQAPYPGQVQGQQYAPAQQPQFGGYGGQAQQYAAAPLQYQQPQQYAGPPVYQQPQSGAYSGSWGYLAQVQQPYAAAPPAYAQQTGYPQQHPAAASVSFSQQPTAGYPPQPGYPPPSQPTAGPAPLRVPSPTAAAAAQPLPQPTADALGLLAPGPARAARPKKLAILLRGLPGSGKSHVARLMREREAAAGGDPPRIMSIDDYFMTEVEKEVEDEEGGRRGRKRKIEVLEYCYEQEMEASYLRSLLKAFQRAVEEERYKFIVVDAPALRVADFKDFWSAGQAAGYEVYVAEPPETDPQVCFERNVHGRSKEDIYSLSAQFEPTPGYYTLLKLGRLLGREAADQEGPGAGDAPAAASPGAANGITEVDMEDEAAPPGHAGSSGTSASMASASGDEDAASPDGAAATRPAASRWAALDQEDGSGSSDEERARGKKQKKAAGSRKGGLPAVDDWRELLAAGKAQLAGGGGGSGSGGRATPRSILSKGSSGGSARKKGRRVRWPDEAPGAAEEEEEAEQGFRIAGGATTAKAGLETVHLVHGLGPPERLEDGSAGVAPHPTGAGSGFAAAARAEHHGEADLFRRLLLSRGGG